MAYALGSAGGVCQHQGRDSQRNGWRCSINSSQHQRMMSHTSQAPALQQVDRGRAISASCPAWPASRGRCRPARLDVQARSTATAPSRGPTSQIAPPAPGPGSPGDAFAPPPPRQPPASESSTSGTGFSGTTFSSSSTSAGTDSTGASSSTSRGGGGDRGGAAAAGRTAGPALTPLALPAETRQLPPPSPQELRQRQQRQQVQVQRQGPRQPPPPPGFDDDSDVEVPEFMEPTVYDAAMNSRYWETRPVRVLARLMHIGLEFGGWALAARVREARGAGSSAAREAAAAEAMKDVLVRLGPAFVKIGQALSSRPDVLPPAYIAALEALQDRIPPFPDEAAMQVLESELGAPVASVFSSLSPAPVAAASLGQVYRAVLRGGAGGEGGAAVAVKVQRPRVAQMIAQDVYILRLLAGALRKARKVNSDLPALVDEWASSLFRELDYRTEASNAKRFKELFSHLPQVYVPHIYDDFTTAKVLTMEWIEGERLRTAGQSAAEAATSRAGPAASSPPSAALAARRAADLELVEVGVRCSLEQMLEEGFYHADPHPGNLLRTPDGRLAYLDFGMMGSIDTTTRTALLTATLHLVNREYGRLAEDFVALGLLPPGTDRAAVLPALTGVFSEALAGGVSNLSFGSLSTDLGQTMYKYSFRIPPYYTLLVRSLSVLEGIALAADPNYKVLGSAYPWIARRLLTDPSPPLRTALRRLLYAEGEGGAEERFMFDRLESLLRQAAKSATRIKRPPLAGEAGAVAAPAGPGARSAASGGAAPGGGGLALLLSEDGEFVRGILLDEVAKGIDGAVRLAADAAVSAARRGVASAPGPALLALLPGAPLLALLAPFAAAPPRPAAGAVHDSGRDMEPAAAVRSALSAALARLPALATADDEAQVAGLAALGAALADVSGLKLPASSSGDGTTPSTPPAPHLPDPGELLAAAATAGEAVRWLAGEAAALDADGRRQLLGLPGALAARLAGRLTARTLRAMALASSPPP